MGWSSLLRAGAAFLVALLVLPALGSEAHATSADLEVVLLDEQRAPVIGARLLLEREQAGGWEATPDASARTGADGRATVTVPLGGPASYRVRVEHRGTPTFAHRFDVGPEGRRSHYPSDHLSDIEAGRVVLALTREDPWPGLHDPAWLVRVNEARAAAGLGPLTQRQDWNLAAAHHTAYVLANQQRGGHFEDPALPGHTLAGEWATSTGNLIWGGGVRSAPQAVQLWLNSPGHAAWILHPGAREVGYAQRFDPDADAVRFSAVMPISQGVDLSVDPGTPVTYPAAGAVLEVGEDPGGRCDQGWSQTHVHATCALHLRRDDLRDLAPSTRFDASVWVDGRSVTATVDAVPDRRRLSVLLAEPLPPNAEVEVRVDVDGLVYERWGFTTRARSLARDVVIGSTHGPAIEAVMVTGIATGYPDGTFRPDLPVSRGQVATMLAAGLDLQAQSVRPPEDVTGSVHASAVGALLEAGVMSGFPDGTSAPDRAMDRAQMASVLARALGLLPA